jgi:predicted RNA-binding protein YlxR (DUF448 family)
MRIALAHPRPDGAAAERARAVHDRQGTMPGRGAYLCHGARPDAPAAECLRAATRRGGIARALRAAATLDPKLVESGKEPARPRSRAQTGRPGPSIFH